MCISLFFFWFNLKVGDCAYYLNSLCVSRDYGFSSTTFNYINLYSALYLMILGSKHRVFQMKDECSILSFIPSLSQNSDVCIVSHLWLIIIHLKEFEDYLNYFKLLFNVFTNNILMRMFQDMSGYLSSFFFVLSA